MNRTRNIRRFALMLGLMFGVTGALGAPAFARSDRHEGKHRGHSEERSQSVERRVEQGDGDLPSAIFGDGGERRNEQGNEQGDDQGGREGEVISDQEAARRAQSRFGGRVLSVDRDDDDGGPGYRVKLLSN